MTDNNQKPSIAQRIAEPMHLRLLHDLLNELVEEVTRAERDLRLKKERMVAVRAILYDALGYQGEVGDHRSDDYEYEGDGRLDTMLAMAVLDNRH